MLVLGGGAAAWELAARADAAAYADELVGQRLVVNHVDAAFDVEGGLAGGSAALHSLGERWPVVELRAHAAPTAESDAFEPFDAVYELHGAPRSRMGTIDETVVRVALTADQVYPLFYQTSGSDVVSGRAEFADGLLRITEEYSSGGISQHELRVEAREGEYHEVVLRDEYNGPNNYVPRTGEETSSDICRRRGFESTLEELRIDGDRLVMRWRVADLDVADLTLAMCLG